MEVGSFAKVIYLHTICIKYYPQCEYMLWIIRVALDQRTIADNKCESCYGLASHTHTLISSVQCILYTCMQKLCPFNEKCKEKEESRNNIVKYEI